jgi:hypothetical protein
VGRKQPSRQAKRRQQRVQAQKRSQAPPRQINWNLWIGAGIILAAVVFFGALVAGHANVLPPTPTPVVAKTIDGVPCDAGMDQSYHVHAHVTILDAGKQLLIPANTNINLDAGCVYWLHTHDTSGIIHIEAPHKITPTLGTFFDIWGQPLSRHRVATALVQPGQSMRVYVDLKPYAGNPHNILLRAHTTVTIEIGPPFQPPKPYKFTGGL